MHVSWTGAPTPSSGLIFLVTAVGGAFYAWLFRRWEWNLWVPIGLHAFMNLSWGLFDVSPNALGGLEANLGRAATIALEVVATLRWTPKPSRPSAPG